MKKYDFYSGIFFVVIGLLTCILTYRLGLGKLNNPGPGLVPLIIGFLIVFLSICLLSKTLLGYRSGRQEKEVLQRIRWGNVMMILCPLVIYGVTLNFLGFPICTFLLMIFLLGVVGHRKWWVTLVVSFCTVLCAYLLFVVSLGGQFPRGPFGY